jgi:DNA (cytosine-5)-methyltransferase 1
MGFPEGYILPVEHTEAVHMMGNAVAPKKARDGINAMRRPHAPN